MPVGTTLERPGSPANGMIRYNTTDSVYEVYDNPNWNPLSLSLYSVEYLIVAGGGGGGRLHGGGGGAGGMLTGSMSMITIHLFS